jgi:hypothetical protein
MPRHGDSARARLLHAGMAINKIGGKFIPIFDWMYHF